MVRRVVQRQETASGETYDMFKLTAAHPELPLGSFVKVTNLSNLRSVIVRINDRGPITPGRVIDLSYKAAEILQFSRKGIQKVRLDVVDQKPTILAAKNLPISSEQANRARSTGDADPFPDLRLTDYGKLQLQTDPFVCF